MKKFNKWKEVKEERYFHKYRMEILQGRCKGVYMYSDISEERHWLINMGEFIESGTEIFFLEKIGDTEYYELTGFIRKD